MNKQTQKLLLDAHIITPGLPGIECLACAEEGPVMLTVWNEQGVDYVCCPACGNALGRADQLMIQVREEGAYFATLAFIG